eukprot:SAG31_NODE_6013_length_2214_cov_3.029314_1_plen_34_part_10
MLAAVLQEQRKGASTSLIRSLKMRPEYYYPVSSL